MPAKGRRPLSAINTANTADHTSDINASAALNAEVKRLEEAKQILLEGLTRSERERVDAYLKHGKFSLAAKELECDRESVARTWTMFSRRLHAALFPPKKS